MKFHMEALNFYLLCMKFHMVPILCIFSLHMMPIKRIKTALYVFSLIMSLQMFTCACIDASHATPRCKANIDFHFICFSLQQYILKFMKMNITTIIWYPIDFSVFV